MPIYEFYCPECHMIFNFFSPRINTEKIPLCPRCGGASLQRCISNFAISKGLKESDEGLPPGFDEEKLEKILMSMTGDIESVDEEDPRQMAYFMKRVTEAAGIKLGPGMEEAIKRMEAGEDPEKIEQELGDVLSEEDFLLENLQKGGSCLKAFRNKYLPPKRDDTLYKM